MRAPLNQTNTSTTCQGDLLTVIGNEITPIMRLIKKHDLDFDDLYEGLVKNVLAIEDYSLVDMPRAYVFAILRNLISTANKKRILQQSLLDELDEDSEKCQRQMEIESYRIHQREERREAARAQMTTIHDALKNKVTPYEASAFKLHHFDNLTFSAIATRLGTTEAAARQAACRARQKIRPLLKAG